MKEKVIQISAIGSRGNVSGKVFVAKPDASGRYVLNIKRNASTDAATNFAVNKVFASDLNEAARLLQSDNYLINLVTQEGQRALRELKAVKIEYAEGSSSEPNPQGELTAPLGRQTGWQQVFDTLRQLGKPSTRRELLTALRRSNPEFKQSNLDADLRLITVNDFARIHHQGHEQPRRTDQNHRYDLVYKRKSELTGIMVFEPYDASVHPILELYRDGAVATKSKLRTRPFSVGVLQHDLDSVESAEVGPGEIDFLNENDARIWISRAIVARRGQRTFRQALIEAYEGACAVTGCTAIEVLEAAHIVPYRGNHTNRVENGLLLRADIHTLFDLGHLWVDRNRIQVAAHLCGTDYGKLTGTPLRVPLKASHRPSLDALAHHARKAIEALQV